MVDRTVLISDWYPADDRPVAGSFIEEQAVALSERYAVTVIAPRLRQWREGRVASRRAAFETRRGITVVRIDAVPALPRSPSLVYMAHAKAVLQAYGAVVERTGRPNLLHAHVIRNSGLSALAVGRRARLPVVLTEHSGPFSVHLTSGLDRRRVTDGLTRFDAVIAVSPFLRDQVTAVADVPIDVIGNVIDTEFFCPDDSRGIREVGHPFRVLTVALLTADKRVDLVIDAVARCAADDKRVELRIVGDGPERRALERRVAELSLGSAVQFVGMSDRTAVRDEMRRADALVLASDAETFGVVLAEAMSCGVPVVATRSGGSDYVVEPGTGLLVPTGDVEALTTALHRLMREPGTVSAAAARDSIVRRFGRAAFLRELGRVYERVVRARSHASGQPPGPSGDRPVRADDL